MLTDQHRKEIAEAIASIDKEMLRYQKTLTVAERVQIGFAMVEVAEQNAIANLCQADPELSASEALRIARSGRTHYLWQRRKP